VCLVVATASSAPAHAGRVRSVEPREQLSNPPPKRLSPTDVDDLVEAYQAGATISRMAADHGIRRATVGEA
jgi:hypothetical protein